MFIDALVVDSRLSHGDVADAGEDRGTEKIGRRSGDSILNTGEGRRPGRRTGDSIVKTGGGRGGGGILLAGVGGEGEGGRRAIEQGAREKVAGGEITGGSREGEEDGEGEDEEKSPQAKKGPKETFQQRINELTKARREAERHAEALERRLGEIEVKLRQDLTAQQDEGKQEEDLPPEAEDFEYGEIDPNYIKALVDFETKQVLAVAKEEFKQERQAEAAAQEAQELRHKWDAQVERGAENFDDFHEKVVTGAEKGEWSLTPDMAELVIESPVGAEIAYYLATHSQESAQVEIGRAHV